MEKADKRGQSVISDRLRDEAPGTADEIVAILEGQEKDDVEPSDKVAKVTSYIRPQFVTEIRQQA